jgi:hypothetical protein
MGRLVAMYLMASYAYYIEDDPIMSDGDFDNLCKDLLSEFDTVVHMHKYLLSKDALRAGTCLLSVEDYPNIVIGAVRTYRRGAIQQ